MKIVMDTSVMTAAILSQSGASRVWLKRCLQKQDDILLSAPLLLEYEAVLTRPHILQDAETDASFINTLLDALAAVCTPVYPQFHWRPALRDPDDEMVLEAAINGYADMILSFNIRDLEMAHRFGIPVMQPGLALQQRKGNTP